MIKKIIEISRERTSLSIKYGQLVVRSFTSDKSEEPPVKPAAKYEERSIPCEDIGVLLIDNPATVYTHSVFTELLKHNAAVIFCDNSHLPVGCLLPIESNTTQTQSFAKQINAKEPIKKKLWQQLIRAKISHQAKIIKDNTQIYKALMVLVDKVRSGDPDNVEARASRIFWQAYIQSIEFVKSAWAEAHPTSEFRRNRDGVPPNNLLNYGYMVVRAAVARAICSAGLLPSVGLHHKNKYNAFCLADDVIEPFRGFVEVKVKEIVQGGEDYEELTQAIKARLLEVLYEEVEISGLKGPLMVGLHRTAASLQRCFAGEQREIDLPKV